MDPSASKQKQRYFVGDGSNPSSRQPSFTMDDLYCADGLVPLPRRAALRGITPNSVFRDLTPISTDAFYLAGYTNPRPEELNAVKRLRMLEFRGIDHNHIKAGVQLAEIGVNDFTVL